MFLLVQLALLFILPTHAKILRVGQEFIAKFTVVDANARLTKGYIQNITTKTTLRKCTSACVRNIECKSFNRNVETEVCELLSISKYDDIGALRGEVGWEHYDTDDDDRKIGTFCMKFSPCKDFQVCEDTFQSNPPYICRCKDGFDGKGCKTYIGPGKKEDKPATFCSAIFRQSADIPDGDYWLKGQTSPRLVNCVRRVDGGFGQWSNYTECTYTCGEKGIKSRNRECDSPKPKGNGKLCKGPTEETQPCNRDIKCPVDGGFGEWSDYTECSHTCGEHGEKSRFRRCDNPEPKNNGKQCVGSIQRTTTCNRNKICQGQTDGNFSAWSAWSTCATLVGLQTSNRSCDNPRPQHGGKYCTGKWYRAKSCSEFQSYENCTMEKGFCTLDGKDKPEKLISGITDLDECLMKCRKKKKSTGCEVKLAGSIFPIGPLGPLDPIHSCHYMDDRINMGSGDSRYNCWVFNKCKGFPIYQIIDTKQETKSNNMVEIATIPMLGMEYSILFFYSVRDDILNTNFEHDIFKMEDTKNTKTKWQISLSKEENEKLKISVSFPDGKTSEIKRDLSKTSNLIRFEIIQAKFPLESIYKRKVFFDDDKKDTREYKGKDLIVYENPLKISIGNGRFRTFFIRGTTKVAESKESRSQFSYGEEEEKKRQSIPSNKSP